MFKNINVMMSNEELKKLKKKKNVNKKTGNKKLDIIIANDGKKYSIKMQIYNVELDFCTLHIMQLVCIQLNVYNLKWSVFHIFFS